MFTRAAPIFDNLFMGCLFNIDTVHKTVEKLKFQERMSVRVENRRTEPKDQIPFYFTKRYLWVGSLRNAGPKSLAIFIFFKIRES